MAPRNQYPIAAKLPALLAVLEQRGQLDRRTMQQLTHYVSEQMLLAEQAKIAQDAASFLYNYELWKINDTLTRAELIKLTQSPIVDRDEIDEWDKERRKRYLDLISVLGDAGNQAIMEGFLAARKRR